MNTRVFLTICVIAPLACLWPTNALAAKGGGKGKQAAAAGNPGGKKGGPGAAGSPKAQLTPYITRLPELLSLDRPKGKKSNPFLAQATGKLTVMKTSYATRQAAAQSPEAASLGAAVATCDAIIAALNERQQSLAQMSTNTSIQVSGDLGRRRKDNFSEGTVGGPLARYQDVKEQARRERKRNQELQQHAAADENFLNRSSVNRWNQRSLQLQQQIAVLYGRIG
ncbi:MAG: hypothetical protein WCF18_02950 [Chthoniobacteraceae bacterium]